MARVKLQTLLDRSNRNMANGTHPVVRESALEMIKRAYKEGINVQISEGHRSYKRQNKLYAQGRTKSGNIVTNARGGQSWHNFGIAIDFFLTNHTGSTAVWTVNSNWRRVAQIGKSLGFEWGGDWTSFKDYPHLQMTGGLSLAQLRAGKKPRLVSKVKNPVKPSASGGNSESVVDYMNRKNMDSSYKNRQKLASQFGISGYKGTSSQNIKLLEKLKSDTKTGWIKNSTGWWFKNKDGSYPKGEWKYIGKQWYLFDNKGYMLTGWQKSKDKWYYMNSSGHMQKGWIQLKNQWYYLDESGAMKKWWFQTKKDGAWYYADRHGHMRTGWLKDKYGRWFYLEESGRMSTGLIEVDSKHYFLQPNGVLITDEIIELEANKQGHLK